MNYNFRDFFAFLKFLFILKIIHRHSLCVKKLVQVWFTYQIRLKTCNYAELN